MEMQRMDNFQIQMDKKIHLNFGITSLSEERTKMEFTHLPIYTSPHLHISPFTHLST
jgi:hypothetical protein